MIDNKNCENHISMVISSYLKKYEQQMQDITETIVFSTGISALDERLGGIKGGEIILLGGRPAMGKTSFAINISTKIAKLFLEQNKKDSNINKSVLYFSLNQSKSDFVQRIIASRIDNIWSCQLARHEYGKNNEEFEKMTNIGKEMSQFPIYICDDYPITIKDIRRKIKEISKFTTIGIIVINYLTLLDRESYTCKEVLHELKSIANELNIPILILSQITTALEKRKNKIPLLTDIREYKNIDEIDKIVFLYRDYYYFKNKEPKLKQNETNEHFQTRLIEWIKLCKEKQNIAEFCIAKNNNGRLGIIKCYCNLDRCEFDDLQHA